MEAAGLGPGPAWFHSGPGLPGAGGGTGTAPPGGGVPRGEWKGGQWGSRPANGTDGDPAVGVPRWEWRSPLPPRPFHSGPGLPRAGGGTAPPGGGVPRGEWKGNGHQWGGAREEGRGGRGGTRRARGGSPHLLRTRPRASCPAAGGSPAREWNPAPCLAAELRKPAVEFSNGKSSLSLSCFQRAQRGPVGQALDTHTGGALDTRGRTHKSDGVDS